jgi:transposase
VQSQTVVACARVASGSSAQQDVRTFGTTTGDLWALADWLTAHGCIHVAMESVGVTGRRSGHLLDSDFALIGANLLQIRNVPGRRSDVKYAIWIPDLLAYRRIRSCVVPPAPIHELRDLTRPRKQLVREIVTTCCVSRRFWRTPT